MIVEFIGISGAGKTTLINEVQHRLVEKRPVTTSSNLVTGLVGLQGIENSTVRNLIQEIVCFPYFLGALLNYKDYITHTIRMFSRNSNFSIMTINNLRSIERKIGVLEIAKRYKQKMVILVDEGPIQAAHMFAFNETQMSPQEMEKFSGLLPSPDLIIYVKASLETLVERSMKRSYPPREMISRIRSENEEYIKRAVNLFDQIIESSSIQPRVLIIDNSSNNKDEFANILDQISNFILNSENGAN